MSGVRWRRDPGARVLPGSRAARCPVPRWGRGSAVPLFEGGVPAGKRVERLLRFPRQVRVGARWRGDAVLLVEELDDAVGGHVQIRAALCAMGAAAGDEAEPEDGVDTLLVEDGHEVVDVADLLALIAHEAGLECDAVRLHGHVPPCAAVVASPAERAAADL